MNLIETKNLTKKYGQQIAVNQLNLQIASGKLTAYLGTNGAGKSTTIKMLTQTLTPTTGEIYYQEEQGPLQVGVVFQSSVLDDELSVWDNLLLRSRMYRGITKKDLQLLMTRTKVSEFQNKKYGHLSGGMRRRVDITRALINRPQVLFLDEPTTGLDPQSRSEIWQLLNELRQETNLGIFLTTHYLEEAELADYVYILEQGQILEEGTVQALKQKYNHPVVYLQTEDSFTLNESLKSYQKVEISGGFAVSVASPVAAMDLLTTVRTKISDFSYQPVELNDVFLEITGREMNDDRNDCT
ncbi:MAG: ATP-binding cassette domain-containing protein [Enterococcus sp.]